MAWEQVIGQDTVKRLLQRAVATGRLPHALLLTGLDGSGVLAIAIALSRTLVCEAPRKDGVHVDACGACRSCRQALTLQHPNITIVTALPAGKADIEAELPTDVIEELSHQIQLIASDPYQPFGLTGATQIRIGQIRELKRSMALSAAQGGWRVVILHHVENLTTEASNAFLKTLEEPHRNVLLILTSAAPERVLPTIASRCQQMHIPPLDDEDLVVALIKEGVDAQEATLLAPFAEGDFTLSRALLREDVQAERTEAINLLRAALKPKEYRVGLVEAVNNAADRKDRQRALLMLSLLALWLRDVQMVCSYGDGSSLANADQRDVVLRFAQSYGTADLSEALHIIERAARDIRRNVTINVVLLTALMELRQLFTAAARQLVRS